MKHVVSVMFESQQRSRGVAMRDVYFATAVIVVSLVIGAVTLRHLFGF